MEQQDLRIQEEITKGLLVPKEEITEDLLVPMEITENLLVPKKEITKDLLIPNEITENLLVPKDEITEDLLVPKEEISTEIEIAFENNKKYIVPKEEMCNSSIHFKDLNDQSKINVLAPIKTELTLSNDIVQLRRQLKRKRDAGVSIAEECSKPGRDILPQPPSSTPLPLVIIPSPTLPPISHDQPTAPDTSDTITPPPHAIAQQAVATSPQPPHRREGARRRRTLTPFDQAARVFMAIEQRYLQLEERMVLNEGRRIEADNNRTKVLNRLADIAEAFSTVCKVEVARMQSKMEGDNN